MIYVQTLLLALTKIRFDHLINTKSKYPMNKFRLLICTVLFGVSVNCLHAQDAQVTKYYRYFTVEFKKINTGDFQALKATQRESATVSFKNICNASSKILVAVDASYPKRVDDMKLEIESIIHSKLPNAKIRATENISVSDELNFCQ